jgi:hypothetical protein
MTPKCQIARDPKKRRAKIKDVVRSFAVNFPITAEKHIPTPA